MNPDPTLSFYPYCSHLVRDVLKPICSEHGGIAQSLLVSPVKYSEDLVIKSVAAQMPAYHKVLLRPDMEMQYHLSGYGTFYEEALIRLAGEVIERYSLMVCQYALADKIRYGSYNELRKTGQVVPFEYLSLFADSDYAKLNQGQYHGLRKLTPDDVVGWVKCPSLFDPSTEIWVPAQMLFVGYKFSPENGEVAFCPGFSTGTAAHTSLAEALRSALLEFIEIDALMLHWYTDLKAPKVIVDNLTVASLVPKLLANDSKYEVLALDLSLLAGVDAHVFGSVLINKLEERPFIVFGAQGDLDPVRAFYRSLMEAVAIAFLGIYGPLYLPNEYLADADAMSFTDLDRNVSFFASPKNADLKRHLIEELVEGRKVLSGMKNYSSGNAQKDAGRLIKQLSSVSQYGVFLDVTPPETRNHGWHVMRVFIPELITMCVPGVPYGAHPRFKAYGGIRNEYPHPLP
jgi:thiazole/oxazole-forming peptide maturase SagD family component